MTLIYALLCSKEVKRIRLLHLNLKRTAIQWLCHHYKPQNPQIGYFRGVFIGTTIPWRQIGDSMLSREVMVVLEMMGGRLKHVLEEEDQKCCQAL